MQPPKLSATDLSRVREGKLDIRVMRIDANAVQGGQRKLLGPTTISVDEYIRAGESIYIDGIGYASQTLRDNSDTSIMYLDSPQLWGK